MKKFFVDKLCVEIFPNRTEMGNTAAHDISEKIHDLLNEKEQINMIFGAAPSQEDMIRALVADSSIPWERINAFHMDEYIGIDPTAPQGFAKFLKDRLFDLVPFHAVYTLQSDAPNPQEEGKRYEELLQRFPPDIVCLGIGENGHIAFNDPPADFHDPSLVKIVTLEHRCRQQQVNDGCFSSLEEVPLTAWTLTVPALTCGSWLFCVVPAKTKAEAVQKTLEGPVSESCPASVLRNHDHCMLYLDPDSSSLLSDI